MRLLLDECPAETTEKTFHRTPNSDLVLRAHSNDMTDLLPLVPEVLTMIERAKPGMAVEVRAPESK